MAKLIVTYEVIEKAEKEAKEKIKARNKAQALIEDARARYIKEKCRYRSKKAAVEKDVALNNPKFDCLKDYTRREDIQEDYGFDAITAQERDRLEELWDLREEIRSHVDTSTGEYRDYVTDALHEAYVAIADIYENDVDNAKWLRDNADNYVDDETHEIIKKLGWQEEE